jgi:hypothetical protein
MDKNVRSLSFYMHRNTTYIATTQTAGADLDNDIGGVVTFWNRTVFDFHVKGPLYDQRFHRHAECE